VTHPRHLTLDRLLAAEAFVLVATLALVMPVQSDTWWHLAAGRDMIETSRVALADTWSHTANGRPWFNHAWGSEILAYLLVAWGGLALVTAAAAALVVATCALVWPLVRGPLEVRALLLILVTIDATGTWTPRAQLVTMLLVAVTLRLVLARRWWWLPPIFAAWANLHGGVAIGGAVLAAALLSAILVDRGRAAALAACGLACLCTSVLTPFGWRYWPELAASVGRITANRPVEWQPPAMTGAHLVFWAALALLLAASVAGWRRLRSFDTGVLVITSLVTGALAASAQRNVPVFLLTALPALTRLAWPKDAAAPVHPARAIEPWRAFAHVTILVASIALSLGVVGRAWTARPSPLGWTPISPAAASAIRACRAPIYNTYDEGGPLAWFVRDQPIFLDSRQDPYPVDLVRADVQAEQRQNYLPLFRRHGIKCAVFPATSRAPETLARAGWHLRFRDARWAVLDPP
jgi:hypothetical protein